MNLLIWLLTTAFRVRLYGRAIHLPIVAGPCTSGTRSAESLLGYPGCIAVRQPTKPLEPLATIAAAIYIGPICDAMQLNAQSDRCMQFLRGRKYFDFASRLKFIVYRGRPYIFT